MENFRAMAEQFERGRAWERVADADALAAVWQRWIENPAAAEDVGHRATDLVQSNRGAVARTMMLIAPSLGLPPLVAEPATIES
jgi:3-deoxy-D-manno-octulosonic-acid transferase